MAEPDRSARPQTQPPGVEGEGLDPYPTYRDGPTTPHRATATKPTDVGLPRSRRTSAVPILIGLVVFALVMLVIVGGHSGGVETAMPTLAVEIRRRLRRHRSPGGGYDRRPPSCRRRRSAGQSDRMSALRRRPAPARSTPSPARSTCPAATRPTPASAPPAQ